ncbi:MAG: glycine/betaine ABC transporter substrate-binding protein [Synechococcus sp. TMED19]|nr:MAG: glycine/betaine ABC transporter substrate-binding protein [Synechococcus sp. TMED19]
MNEAKQWRRRALMLTGLLLAGASLASIVRLSRSTTPTAAVGESAERTALVQRDHLRLGWSPWADAEVVSLMAEQLIETHYDVPVERVMADIGIQYQSVARGDLDLMLMAWLPGTHRDYWERVRDQVLDLGPMYSGKLGWVVPDYVPASELNSISDLSDPALAKRFGNRVQGIDPGSGLNQSSEQALKSYRLKDIELISASSAAMTAVLAQAIREQRWVVVTSWTPHWMFARYQLRFLEDPEGVFGGTERIHAVARLGLDQQFPQVTDFLSRFHIPDQELSAVLLNAQNTSAQEAVMSYLKLHPERVRYWLSGEMNP